MGRESRGTTQVENANLHFPLCGLLTEYRPRRHFLRRAPNAKFVKAKTTARFQPAARLSFDYLF